MKTAAVFVLAVLLLSGCSMLRYKQAADAYNAKMAANQTEYENGQILLSEKLRRDYLAGVQYGQINKIEAACTQSYMWLARDLERNEINDHVFNDKRNTLEMACSMSYATGDYSHVDVWRTGYSMSTVYRRK